MHLSRRQFVLALSVLPVLSGCTDDLSDIAGYATSLQTFIDTLAPVVVTLDPAKATQIQHVKNGVDQAVAALLKLIQTAPSDSASESGVAATLISWVSEGLVIADAIPALPVQAKAALAAAQVLLIAIGTFFKLPLSATTAPAVVGSAVPPSPRLTAEALSRYTNANDKQQTEKDAQAEILAWAKNQ